MKKKTITVETIVQAPSKTVWTAWTEPEHITKWAFASDDWEAPSAENDVRVGGVFKTRMQAKDGSAGFDFGGTYTVVELEKAMEYRIGDGRLVRVSFEDTGDGIKVLETFEMEDENSEEKQRSGWKMMLENFKKYAESL